jgi:6-phosphogluconolactonase
MPSARVQVFGDAESLMHAAAEAVVSAALCALAAQDGFLFCVSGGRTPKPLYELLASDAFARRIDWRRAHVLFGDERCVPKEHEASNYWMLQRALLQHVPLPRQNIHPIEAERLPVEAAAAYEARLRMLLGATQSGAPARALDLVLLGLGTDAHTASLFPYSVDEPERWVSARTPEPGSIPRVTLTPSVLNAANTALFLVSGADKAATLATVLEGPRDPLRLPAQRIQPLGELLFMVDAAAAARLDGSRMIAREPASED